MATASPMAEYNRRNPFVIQARKQYETLLNMYQEAVKIGFICIMVFLACVLLLLPITIVADTLMDNPVEITVGYALFSTFQVLMGIWIAHRIVKTTIGHPINKDIETIVGASFSDVVNVNLEAIYECINSIREHQGRVNQLKSSLRTVIICSIIMTILCGWFMLAALIF